ncbi:MAG: hypothetical protein PHI27_03230 [Eubacteriales bacterium]|nr:hypothetical protein [Eubacteriales bacterium]MDD3881249.1 hypothetical protein [Eubacteriales bacterium]MDD4512167.1 hypothetical protein [Eubacteriales bacterium]
MKKIMCALLILALLLPPFALAEGEFGALFAGGSETMSPSLARFALDISSRHTAELTAKAFEENGIEVLLQRYYDKPHDETSHTAAFTVGKAAASVGGASREICVIAIRGTNGAEWYSNFDFAPSQSDETIFAENLLFAAQDIFLSVNAEIKKWITRLSSYAGIAGERRAPTCSECCLTRYILLKTCLCIPLRRPRPCAAILTRISIKTYSIS